MKNTFPVAMVMAILFLATSCEKDSTNNSKGNCDNLPHSAAPSGIAGRWANGFTNHTQIIDIYTGRYLGNTWQSGKYFEITRDGRNAQFYFMAQSQYMQSATKASGTINFEPGSSATAGAFTFHACSAHYKGWGSTTVDRDATQSELENNLTGKYYYRMEGQWLRIQPNGPVNDYSSSFRLVN